MLARSFERAVEGAVHWSVEHRKAVLIGSLLLTMALVPGIFQISVHNRMTDWLDPDEPEAAAFLRGIEALPAMVDFERTLLVYQGDDPAGLLSIPSLREQERLVDAVRGDVPEITGALGPVTAVQLTAYEMAKARGEDPQTARLPASDQQLQLAIDLTQQHQAMLLDYTMANEGIGFIGFTFAAVPFEAESNRVGGAIDDAIHRAYAEGFTTLTGEHKEAIGVASVTDHVNGLLTRDILVLGGLGVGLVFVLFLLAAGRPVAVVGGFLSLALGLLWTLGILGWLQVPFNVLNFAILPLVMGNGIDYSIHVLAEAHHDRRGFGKGLARHLGKALGVPIVLVTLTTCIGLATLGFSGSPYLQQMGLTAAGSIALIAVLSLTFIPAFLATFAKNDTPPRKERAGRLFVVAGTLGRRYAPIVTGIVVVTALAGAVAVWTTDFSVDVFEHSLPDGDPLVAAEKAYEKSFGNSDVWFMVLEGDITSDASFAFQERLLGQLVQRGIVVDDDHVFDLRRLAEGHHALRATPAGLGGLLPLLPSVQDEPTAEEKVAAMEAEAPYREISQIIVATDHQTGAVFVLPPPEIQDVASTDAMQAALEAAVDAADPPLDVHVYGYKRLARDLMAETQQSLQVLYVVSLGSTLVLFYAVTRSVRATALVAAPVLVSSLWWFGLMRLTVGTLDVYQLLSLIFITSIGSDYAAYLVYKFRDTGDWVGTLQSTGRAVLFSAVTDAGAFLVFSFTRVRSGGDMLLGAALAIVAIFVATLLIVPPLLGAGGRRSLPKRSI